MLTIELLMDTVKILGNKAHVFKGGWKQGRELGRAGVGGKGRKQYLNNNKKMLKKKAHVLRK